MNEQRPGVFDRRPSAGGDEDVVDLIAKLTRQGAHLAQEQVSLMQAEVREAAADAKAAAGAMAGAAVVGVAGLGVLLMGIAYLVADAIGDLALGTILVGVVTLIVAAIMYAGGRKKVEDTRLAPRRTIDTVEDTPAAMSGDMHHSGGIHAR